MIDLYLYDNLENEDAMLGLKAELFDSAFPLLNKVVVTSSLETAFRDSHYNFLAGTKQRDHTQQDDIEHVIQSSQIYTDVAKALSDNSFRCAYSIVLGNPPNTNCLICCHYAKGIPKENFSALSRLDHNRAISALALMTDSKVSDISKVVVWGNHSETIYPDIRHALIQGKKVSDLVSNEWI